MMFSDKAKIALTFLQTSYSHDLFSCKAFYSIAQCSATFRPAFSTNSCPLINHGISGGKGLDAVCSKGSKLGNGTTACYCDCFNIKPEQRRQTRFFF